MWNASRGEGTERRARAPDASIVESVLNAAAARPDELPELPPFFVARVKAATGRRRPQMALDLVASVAWHAMPVLVVLVATLSLWAGVEMARDAAAQEDVAMVVLHNRDAGADAPLAALLLSDGGESIPSGRGR